MRISLVLFFALLLASCANKDISRDSGLVFFANNFQLMSETKNIKPTLFARLLKLREFGECDSGKCPGEVVYVAVSEFGEYPEQRLYVTKQADEWHFAGWEHVPASGREKQVIVFKMKSKINGIETEHTIKVSLDNIEYTDRKEITRNSGKR